MTTEATHSEALDWYGLQVEPFAPEADPQFFFPVPAHANAISYCTRTVAQQIGIGLVYGAPGTGKTMLARRLESVLKQTSDGARHFAYLVDGAGIGRAVNPFLRGLALALGARRTTPNYRLLDAIEHESLRLLEEQTVTVLIIDRAETLEEPILASIVHLWNLVTPDASRFLVRIVLFAHPSFYLTLDKNKHEALKSRVSIATPVLAPLDRETLAALVEHRVRVARGPEGLFAADALDALYAASEGVPARAIALAASALREGYAASETPITAASIARAVERLVTPAALET